MQTTNRPFTRQKAILVATIGTILEWAEYTFYGYIAFTLAGLFFPSDTPNLSLINTLAIFAIGYIMRPLGAIIFGHLGDKYSRKLALMISMLLMGIATFGIGLLPTYHTIGIWAPILLLCLRLVQGIAVSGEYNGAGIFLIEQAGKNRPCFAGSFIPASAALGMVLGGLAAYFVSLPGMPEWSWRIPFLLGGLSCLISGYLRQQISESPEFINAKHQHKIVKLPILKVLKTYKANLLFVASVAAFTGVYVYIGNIYFVIFLREHVGLPTYHATFFAMAGEALVVIFILIMGYIADKINPQKLFCVGLLSSAFGAPLIFGLANTGIYFYIGLSMLIYAILNGIVCGPMVKLLNDQFPAELRYTGISSAWSISAAIFGGTAPLVAQTLTVQYEGWLATSLYISLFAIIALIVVTLIPKLAKREAPYARAAA